MKIDKVSAEQIDNLLPQTQCGDCSYNGCLPYAEAIINNHEKINRCLPGGVEILKKLGELMQQDLTAPVEELLEELKSQEKSPTMAVIIEDQCMGCTKCIQACPVDAIIGSAKQMHTVISQECTGCGLCVAPCPVDCIEMITIQQHSYHPKKSRTRYQLRNKRLQSLKKEKINQYQQSKLQTKTAAQQNKQAAKRELIIAAVKRAKQKKKLDMKHEPTKMH